MLEALAWRFTLICSLQFLGIAGNRKQSQIRVVKI